MVASSHCFGPEVRQIIRDTRARDRGCSPPVSQEAERGTRSSSQRHPFPPAIHFLYSGPTYHSFHQLPVICPAMNLAVDESTDEFRHSWPVSEHGLGNKALDA